MCVTTIISLMLRFNSPPVKYTSKKYHYCRRPCCYRVRNFRIIFKTECVSRLSLVNRRVDMKSVCLRLCMDLRDIFKRHQSGYLSLLKDSYLYLYLYIYIYIYIYIYKYPLSLAVNFILL